MYDVNTSIDSEGSGANFLDVGIHDDVELIKVEFKTSSEGSEFMVFQFEKDGKKLSHTEWKPRDEDDERLENKTKNQIKRVKHIVTKFIPEDKYVFSVTDFKSFCENTINLLGETYKGKKVRIKVIYSFNNYTSLPRYVPFIELMSVDKTKLEILSIDKMKKEIPDANTSESNPFKPKDKANTELPTEVKSDLPF